MSNSKNMYQLMDKLNDLKNVFNYGQKIIPIIQSLNSFMEDTAPLLENINRSIEESTNKFPKVQNHIDDINSATELATTEILDIVDEISRDVDDSLSSLKSVESGNKDINSKIDELKIKYSGDSDLVNTLDQLKVNNKQEVNNICEKLGKIKDNSHNITLSLQVQDITSQQLASINNLIQSVKNRLSCLIVDIGDADLTEVMETVESKPITFDENAQFKHDDSSQNYANDVFDNPSDNTSQDEIDKLFAGQK